MASTGVVEFVKWCVGRRSWVGTLGRMCATCTEIRDLAGPALADLRERFEAFEGIAVQTFRDAVDRTVALRRTHRVFVYGDDIDTPILSARVRVVWVLRDEGGSDPRIFGHLRACSAHRTLDDLRPDEAVQRLREVLRIVRDDDRGRPLFQSRAPCLGMIA